MKSIKPGRGPSLMSGIVGIFMICCGIGWTILASQTHWSATLFGICWTCIAIATTVYNFKNATNKIRYSEFDITDEFEESDPLNERFGSRNESRETILNGEKRKSRYCPYCGTAVKDNYEFCNNCGKRLP